MTDTKETAAQEAMRTHAEQKAIATQMNESTGLSWLWALLFGPIYFWVHGFTAQGFIVLGVALLTLGVGGMILSLFIVYPAWRKRAEEKAQFAQLMRR